MGNINANEKELSREDSGPNLNPVKAASRAAKYWVINDLLETNTVVNFIGDRRTYSEEASYFLYSSWYVLSQTLQCTTLVDALQGHDGFKLLQ